jgi:hypothetical protein
MKNSSYDRFERVPNFGHAAIALMVIILSLFLILSTEGCSGVHKEVEYTVSITYENGISEVKSVMLPENSVLYLTEKSCGRRYLWTRSPAPFGTNQPVVMQAVNSFGFKIPSRKGSQQ